MTTRDAVLKREAKSPQELYEEREKRVRDAIQLKEPDRVPVLLGLGYFPARYTGVPTSAAYYDIAAWKEANKKTIVDFEPDLYRASTGANSGSVLETLGTTQMEWPGGKLATDVSHQMNEVEYMKEDEYDLFLSDPTDYMLRVFLPRQFRALEPLAKLPSLNLMWGQAFTTVTPLFTATEFKQVAKTLYQAGLEEAKWRKARDIFDEEMAKLGFPPHGHPGGVGGAPFDMVTDNIRGMQGSMIDMYRRPEKLLALCDKILEWRAARAALADPKKRGNPKRLFLALHRGAEGFMSKKQFERFYWPGLKKAILTSIDLGFVPMPFFEGRYQDRLEYLLELPRGKVVCHFEHMDMARAKEVLGGHLCIMGNVPSSLLQAGSAQEVDEYCHKLIKVCGKGGGFILTNASSIDEAKPANVKAMVDSVRKYAGTRGQAGA